MSVKVEFTIDPVKATPEEVIKWYKGMDGNHEEEAKNIVVTHIKDRKYLLSFQFLYPKEATEGRGKILAEFIVNPDEDSNYPLNGKSMFAEMDEKTYQFTKAKRTRVTKKKTEKVSTPTAATTAASSKKRCPKGTRKDKKSGDCVKK